MKRLPLWLLAGLACVAIGVGVWQAIQRRQPSITLSTGEKIRVIGFTYGRKHLISTWRFQWAWPPVERLTHRLDTETEALVLWMRRTAPHGFLESAVVVDDSGQEVSVCFPEWFPGAIADVYPHLIAGVPPDGKRITLKFYDRLPHQTTGELTLRLPRIESALQPQQPEPLPAVREVNGARVRLTKVEWGCSWIAFHQWRLQPLARPHLQVEPEGDLVPLRAVVAPVGAGYREPYDVSAPHAAPLIGSLDLPVYQLVIWFKHRPTGRRQPVKFFVAPPPTERFLERRQYVDQITDAIVRADYQSALRLCDKAQSRFPDLAAFYRGYALALQGRYRQAIQAWQGLGKPRFEDPWRDDPRPAVALCHLLRGDARSAQAVARAWRADWNLNDRVMWLDYSEITLSAASPATAISESEVRQALTLLNPKRDPKNPDYQRRFRAARAIAERRYRDALNELQSLQIKHLITPQDRLLKAYLLIQRGEAESARPLLQQVEGEVSEVRRPDWWNLRLLGRILFPNEWRL